MCPGGIPTESKPTFKMQRNTAPRYKPSSSPLRLPRLAREKKVTSHSPVYSPKPKRK